MVGTTCRSRNGRHFPRRQFRSPGRPIGTRIRIDVRILDTEVSRGILLLRNSGSRGIVLLSFYEKVGLSGKQVPKELSFSRITNVTRWTGCLRYPFVFCSY